MVAATEFPVSPMLTDAARRNRLWVRIWLYCVIVTLFAIVLVGGATRLTDSGLSITEWKPIHGVIPPLGEAEWAEEFARYQQIPEYEQINKGMSLEEFKGIFWWEWAHRLLARGVGFVFALPLLFFWVTGRLERHLKPKLLGILALGGLQGAVGWWMVASGLSERVDVSQYRLATHLTIACLIFNATMAVARGLAPHSGKPALDSTRRFAFWLVVAVLVQIYLGGLVAGLDAGMAYNTWPLMDGALVPQGLFEHRPAWVNLFENPKTVQFVHRLGAYVVLLLALWHAIATLRAEPDSTHARRAVLLFLLVCVQAAIGIATLLMVVPMDVALAHQAMALIVLGFATAHWRATRGAYPFMQAAA
ncbi:MULTISPECIES: COX15/CtaA family protein [Chelativorans]|jgi:cytochrome c oxidase assembly protein subunit 15|uniref:Heme A synthase n=1 Tax=Chelativorans sp. (strain BNC1) TaxID=266779 RepID=CTAA_CHESB|nr:MULTISPECIES: COX15/CtaA family protein [Chelativorans]Q11J69.1 RecName: Full=Heme A synthase; Short=HAS; AltName: Full=Cytochrome aa3-controlling protein [Chelativorans sp. BNC1]